MSESTRDRRAIGSRVHLLGRLQVQDKALEELRAQIVDLEVSQGAYAVELAEVQADRNLYILGLAHSQVQLRECKDELRAALQREL